MASPAPPPPPPTPLGDVVEALFGHSVADPYRWLEDTASAATDSWVEAQNDRTRMVLDPLPQRNWIHRRVSELLSIGSVGAPEVAADRLFTLDRGGDRNQAVLVMRDAIDPSIPPVVIVDPHELAADHTVSVDWFSPSPDGGLIAFGTAEAGSEHGVLRIVALAENEGGQTGGAPTVTRLDDTIPNVRHPVIAWLPDGSAFAYNRLPDPATVEPGDEGYGETLWWHTVGLGPETDEPILTDGLDRTALPMAVISPDGHWLLVHIHLMPTRTDVLLINRTTGERAVVVEGEEASTWCQVTGDRFVAVTTLGAPRGRVVTATLDRPRVTNWATLVPESESVIDSAVVAGGHLLVASTRHGVSHLHRYELDGTGGEELDLPGMGALESIDADPAQGRVFITYSSFVGPSALWRWTPEDGLREWSDHSCAIDPDDFVVEQVFYPSSDGQEVPMFLVRSAGTEVGPDTPTTLSAYGGFAVPSTPGFGPGTIAFCEAGGVYALAGIRGGSEYGEDWHRAGMLSRKQQCFDDFFAAAEWLIGQGRTSPERLAIRGGSNGGLLVGAAVTQRPELFAAAACAVPLLDMLRYHRFLIGALWIPEYGDPDRAEDFEWLRAYSPYHNVSDGIRYPATIITTAHFDSRVHPMHAFKFTAALQAAGSSGPTELVDDRPVLLRIEGKAGHGVGKPAWKQADEAADIWGFVMWRLGMDAPEGTC